HNDDIEETSNGEKDQSDKAADEDSPGNAEELQGEQSIEEKESDRKESEEDTDEYNEFGIKKGTEVYGEDISELTEEELQYIPEAWRDGEFESEHPDEPGSEVRLFSNYPDVNKYIESNNLTAPKIEYNHINHLTKFNYRNGFGKPEGEIGRASCRDRGWQRVEG